MCSLFPRYQFAIRVIISPWRFKLIQYVYVLEGTPFNVSTPFRMSSAGASDGSKVIGVVLLVRHGDREGFYQNPNTYTASATSITPLGNVRISSSAKEWGFLTASTSKGTRTSTRCPATRTLFECFISLLYPGHQHRALQFSPSACPR
jgi:hypothetical protein